MLTPNPAPTDRPVNYARLSKFIQDTIAGAGHLRAGKPNVASFFRRYKAALSGTGFRLERTTFRRLASDDGPESRPYGATLEALALILSAARGEAVTPGILNSLIDRPLIDAILYEVDPNDIPSEEAAIEFQARRILAEFMALPIDVRATIAPKMLDRLGKDWAYLDANPPVQMGKVLRQELYRRGIGIEKYAAEVLDGTVPLEALEAIVQGRTPHKKFSIQQLLKLQANLVSVDGDTITFAEMAYLAPHLDLPAD
jgi:hypothetical protein